MRSILSTYRYLFGILLIALILRVVELGKFPIGLYSDEAVFGYNAYLLLATGQDEYGRSWPVSFQSFGDWKPPMQGWLAMPFVAWLGLTETAVRLPSVLLGTATVAVVYFLAEFLKRSDLASARSDLNRVPLLAALLLAINPWHIFMSRIAMLVSVEVFFVSLGVLALLRGLKNQFLWIVAALSFAGAIYSYYGSRVTVPLILLGFVAIYFQYLKSHWKQLLLPLVVGFLMLLPLLVSASNNLLVLNGRAKTTSIFFNDNVRLMLWEAHTKAGLKGIGPIPSRMFDNKLYYYTRDITSRYLSHLSPNFLFFQGDRHPPFKIPRLGYLHLVDLPFFIFGLWLLRRQLSHPEQRRWLFLALYLFISPLVASFTFLTPAANRSFNLVVPWTLITAYGLAAVLRSRTETKEPGFGGDFFPSVRSDNLPSDNLKGKNLSEGVSGFEVMPDSRAADKTTVPESRLTGNITMPIFISAAYVASLLIFAYSYIKLIPQELPHHWHYGRRELVHKLKPHIQAGERIYLSSQGGPSYIFLSFYLPISPTEFYQTISRNPVIDKLGWAHVDGVVNVTVPRDFTWAGVAKDPEAIYIGYGNEIPQSEVDILDQVYFPNGKVAYTIAKIK